MNRDRFLRHDRTGAQLLSLGALMMDRGGGPMPAMEPVDAHQLGHVATSNPTLTLLAAYSRDWVLPLFAEHIEAVEGSVSAEWFHDRVAEALTEVRDDKDWKGDRSPSARCA